MLRVRGGGDAGPGGLPPGDLNELPTSSKRFPDGAQYRVEIPSVEGPKAFAAVLEEAEARRVRVHRISQGSGVMLLTDGEIVEDDEGNPRMIAEKPLLDHETWNRVVLKLRDNRAFGPKVTKSTAMLVGVAACGHCGGPLTRAVYTNRQPAKGDRPAKEWHYSRYKCSRQQVRSTCESPAASR